MQGRSRVETHQARGVPDAHLTVRGSHADTPHASEVMTAGCVAGLPVRSRWIQTVSNP